MQNVTSFKWICFLLDACTNKLTAKSSIEIRMRLIIVRRYASFDRCHFCIGAIVTFAAKLWQHEEVPHWKAIHNTLKLTITTSKSQRIAGWVLHSFLDVDSLKFGKFSRISVQFNGQVLSFLILISHFNNLWFEFRDAQIYLNQIWPSNDGAYDHFLLQHFNATAIFIISILSNSNRGVSNN